MGIMRNSETKMRKNDAFSRVITLTLCWSCACANITRPLPAQASTGREGPERVFENFDANHFTHPTTINNPWLPLQSGRQWIYEGTTTEDGETLSHRIDFTVTDLTKEIAGVQTVVALVVDFADDEMVEKEIAFFAQDDDGNVWFFGEYPEEYEDGALVDAPTWLAGLDGANAGIAMKAKPAPGTPSYFQGWGPAVGWSDYGRVDKVGEKTCVPLDCYDDVLVIAESALDEPNGVHLKYYARGVGNIRVGWKGDDKTKEELELVKFAELDPPALGKIRAEALALERHAYEVSSEVYALSTPSSGSADDSSARDAVVQPRKPAASSEVSRISEERAKEIALDAVPGDITHVGIERKLGAKRYVVEVLAREDGAETDVIIDMQTGEILGIEN